MQDLRQLRAASFDADSDEVTAAFRAVATGDLLDRRYEVIERIGSGGMADVFRGWDVQLCRDVAIKVLKLARVNESMKKRVLREARALCAIDHPHMLRVLGMGHVGEVPFLIMDLLRGVSLAELLRRTPGGRLDWRYAVTLLLPAMDALHAAHEAGFVHRDVKPENLFLHRRRDGEALMVVDLGIVKFTELDGTPTPRWTQTGMILGTAATMAPEQAMAGPIDRRTDVYSMGVTLYRVLAGHHLFPSVTEDGPIAAMSRHIYEPPPRLSDAEFPRALVEAVFVALAKDPEERHASMAAFAGALRGCLDAPTTAAETSSTVRPGSAMRLAGAVAAGVALTLLTQRVMAPEAAAVSVAASEAVMPVDASEVRASPVGASEERALPVAESEERALFAASEVRALFAASEVRTLPVSSAPGVGDETSGLCLLQEAPDAVWTADVQAGEPVAAEVVAERSASARGRGRRIVPGPGAASPAAQLPDLFAGERAAVRRCVDRHGDPEARSLAVHAAIREDGSVASVGIAGGQSASFLADCVRARLVQLRFEPGPLRTLEHTYHFVSGEVP